MRGTCPLTAKLYFWNEGTQVWDDSATAWSGYTASNNFITTNSNPTAGVTSDSGTMSVHFQSPTTAPAVKPFLDILVKITLEDERADNDCSATVNQQGPNTACTLNQAKLEWQFTLQLRDRCADDTITLDTQINSITYEIESGDSPTYAIGYTQLYGPSPYNCDLEHNMYLWDDVVLLDWKE